LTPPTAIPSGVWAVGKLNYVNTISEPVGSEKRYLSDKIIVQYNLHKLDPPKG